MAGKVRILKEKLFKIKKDDTKLLYVEGACDNDATPPQGNFVTGSAFENVTSGNKYKYSETSGDWVLQPSEGGTGGGVLVCTLPNEGNTLDKTWKEIHDAFPSSVVVLISNGEGYSQMLLATSIGFADELYYVGFASFGETEVSTKYYSVATENGYPVEEVG